MNKNLPELKNLEIRSKKFYQLVSYDGMNRIRYNG